SRVLPKRDRLLSLSCFAASTRRPAVALPFPSGRAADSLEVASRPRREVREPPHAGKALPVRRDGIDSGAPEPSSGSLRERTGKHDGPSPQPPPHHSDPGRSFMPTTPLSHADALARWREGNERFSHGTRSLETFVGQARLREFANGQAPFACILTCSDS